MRKIVLMLSVSLDGFFEGPNHELDWQLVDDELHGHFNEVLGGMGGFLSGRVTYELMAGFWPTADEDPASTKPLYVHPVLIGRGKRLFESSDVKVDLRLAETRAFGSGVVLLRYQRLHGGGPG